MKCPLGRFFFVLAEGTFRGKVVPSSDAGGDEGLPNWEFVNAWGWDTDGCGHWPRVNLFTLSHRRRRWHPKTLDIFFLSSDAGKKAVSLIRQCQGRLICEMSSGMREDVLFQHPCSHSHDTHDFAAAVRQGGPPHGESIPISSQTRREAAGRPGHM